MNDNDAFPDDQLHPAPQWDDDEWTTLLCEALEQDVESQHVDAQTF